jgi:hypothetical protein
VRKTPVSALSERSKISIDRYERARALHKRGLIPSEFLSNLRALLLENYRKDAKESK